MLFSFYNTPYRDEALSALREEFLKSDIAEEMYQTQDIKLYDRGVKFFEIVYGK